MERKNKNKRSNPGPEADDAPDPCSASIETKRRSVSRIRTSTRAGVGPAAAPSLASRPAKRGARHGAVRPRTEAAALARPAVRLNDHSAHDEEEFTAAELASGRATQDQEDLFDIDNMISEDDDGNLADDPNFDRASWGDESKQLFEVGADGQLIPVTPAEFMRDAPGYARRHASRDVVVRGAGSAGRGRMRGNIGLSDRDKPADATGHGSKKSRQR